MLVRSDGVHTRKEKTSSREYFTAVAVSIRVFFARLLAVATSDVTDSDFFSACALEEVCGNFNFSLSEYFLALRLACQYSRDPIYLM